MRKKNILKQFIKDKKGATAIEYALIAALVAVTAIVGFTFLGTQNTSLYGNNSSEVSTVVDKAIENAK